jgi:histidinol-phosphate aminotransferase
MTPNTTPAAGALPPTRPGYDAIPLYSPGGDARPCTVDLSDSINLWGAPPAALDALRAAATSAAVAHYPPLYNAGLREPLAAYAGVRPEHVVTGCGSDGVLDCVIRAFGEPGGVLAHMAPTFSMVPVYARSNGLTPVGVPVVGDDYAVDADALLATDASVIYLCSPNNPTATPLAREAVLRVVERARGLVILDEAYAEFVAADPAARAEVFTPEAPAWGRVLVLRTLSKAFGLAGLRVGYGVGHPLVVREVEKARGPFNVAYPSEKAAIAALGDAPGALPWVREHAARAVAQRNRLLAGLRALGLAPAPSVSNFVFLPVPRAGEIARRLRARGVATRLFAGMPQTVPALRASGGEGLRLGVGPDAVLDAFLAALGEVLEEMNAGRREPAHAGARA